MDERRMYPSTAAPLIDGVLARLREAPQQEALRDELGAITRGELVAASGRLAFALLRDGVRRGDRMVLALPADRRFVITLLAALRLGVVVVPVHPKAKLRELSHVLWDAGPRLAVADEPVADLVRTSARGVRLVPLERLLAAEYEDHGLDLRHDHAGITASADDDALILYTSGTTGKPKGAVHTQGSLAANLAAVAEAWAMGSHDRLLHCLPLHHLHGLVVGLLGGLLSGVTIDLHGRFEAELVLERLARDGVTLFFGVPSMYSQLVERGPRAPLPRMRLFVSGSATLPPALKREFEARFGHVILERYGATEAGIMLSQALAGPRPAGSVGRPLAGVEARVMAVDEQRDGDGAEATRDRSPGGGATGDVEEGELEVRGPSLFRGYHEDDEATARVLRDGWYRTGDWVRREADGTFRILGRLASDVIKVHGHRVGALEIESLLAEHPGVAEVAVIGAPDPVAGQVPIAFVRRRDAKLDEEQLRAFAASALAPYQVPARLTFVEDFPRTGPGKIDRARLASTDAGSIRPRNPSD